MPATQIVSVAQYLSTSYHPDQEYVDGELVERNVGELDHANLQTEIASYLRTRQRRIGIFVIVEQRVQVSRTRFRVPDICVLAGEKPAEQIITTPPLVVIEILSKDDRAAELQEKVSDYLNFGIAAVWVINPLTRRAWVYTADGAFEAKDGILRSTGPDFELSLPEIFSNLE